MADTVKQVSMLVYNLFYKVKCTLTSESVDAYATLKFFRQVMVPFLICQLFWVNVSSCVLLASCRYEWYGLWSGRLLELRIHGPSLPEYDILTDYIQQSLITLCTSTFWNKFTMQF